MLTTGVILCKLGASCSLFFANPNLFYKFFVHIFPTACWVLIQNSRLELAAESLQDTLHPI